MTSQYIFEDGKIKSRLIRNPGENWFVGEWKYVNDFDENDKPNITDESIKANSWFPWICGTKEFLCLSDEEVKNSYPPKERKKAA